METVIALAGLVAIGLGAVAFLARANRAQTVLENATGTSPIVTFDVRGREVPTAPTVPTSPIGITFDPHYSPVTGTAINNPVQFVMSEKPATLFEQVKTPVTLRDLYQRHSTRYGVDPLLLRAVARVESSENVNAENPSDPSFGVMQVLCTKPGKSGEAYCSNALPAVPEWPPTSKAQLMAPDYNVMVGAQILAWNIRAYGTLRGIAVYNRWASRNDPRLGPFGNQGYVDKVLREYAAIGGNPNTLRR